MPELRAGFVSQGTRKRIPNMCCWPVQGQQGVATSSIREPFTLVRKKIESPDREGGRCLLLRRRAPGFHGAPKTISRPLEHNITKNASLVGSSKKILPSAQLARKPKAAFAKTIVRLEGAYIPSGRVPKPQARMNCVNELFDSLRPLELLLFKW